MTEKKHVGRPVGIKETRPRRKPRMWFQVKKTVPVVLINAKDRDFVALEKWVKQRQAKIFARYRCESDDDSI